MKIHVEFNNVAEMVNYSKFIINTVSTSEVSKQTKVDWVMPVTDKKIEDLQYQLDRATANLERAYARLRMADPEGKTANKSERQFKAEQDGVELIPLYKLKAGRRAFNCLNGNVEYIQDFENLREIDLMKLPGMGKVTLNRIKEQLQKQFKMTLKGN